MDYLRRAADTLFHALGVLAATPGLGAQSDKKEQSDAIYVAWLLQQKLPGDLVPLILDFGQVWHVAHTAQSVRPDRVGELQGPKLQAALIVPSHIPGGAIRRIRYIINSRDQGWSDYEPDHGTYRGSWTWFEAGVRLLKPPDADEEAAIQESVDCQHRNGLDEEHHRLCLAVAERYRYGSKRIATNVHAGRDFKTHFVEWDAYHEDEDVRRMMKELRPGCRVEVSAHARFAGWCNYVQSVVIELECATVRHL